MRAAIKLNSPRSLRRETTRRSSDCAMARPRISKRIPRLVKANKAMAKRANKRDPAGIALTRAGAKPSYPLASRKPSSPQKRYPYSMALRLARLGRLLTRYPSSQGPWVLRARLLVPQTWRGLLSQ
jgi:hypothetical protein